MSSSQRADGLWTNSAPVSQALISPAPIISEPESRKDQILAMRASLRYLFRGHQRA